MLKRKDENTKYFEDIVAAAVAEYFDDSRLVKKQGQFVIRRADGQNMRMRSGKTVWGGKGPASNALSNHLGRLSKKLKPFFKNTTEYKKYLLAEGYVSIVEVK